MFSRLLLEERMRVAVNMLCSRHGYGQAIAEKMRLFKQVLLYFCISPLLWLPARQICIQGKGLIIDFHLIIIFWLGPLAQW